MNLAVQFIARLFEKSVRIASAMTEKCRSNNQLSLTRQDSLIITFRALKRTAKFILPLTRRKLFLEYFQNKKACLKNSDTLKIQLLQKF